MIIQQHTRLFWRLGLVALTVPSALIGFAGLRFTSAHLNSERRSDIAQEQRLDKAQQYAETRKALATADAEAKAAEAEAYSELGLRQAACGSTLSRFYFQPGLPVFDQLQQWGFDWQSPRYNTGSWHPLFDSNNLLFAAIRKSPTTGQREIVQADLTSMDQASICNHNQLKIKDDTYESTENSGYAGQEDR